MKMTPVESWALTFDGQKLPLGFGLEVGPAASSGVQLRVSLREIARPVNQVVWLTRQDEYGEYHRVLRVPSDVPVTADSGHCRIEMLDGCGTITFRS